MGNGESALFLPAPALVLRCDRCLSEHGSKLRWCHSGGWPEGASERAVVVKAASASDIGDRILGVTKEFGSGAEACLQDELVGRKSVYPFDEAGKAGGVQAGDVGKPAGG